MPPLSAKYRALTQIALLANSESPAEDIVRSMLKIAGEVVGAESLELVLPDGAPCASELSETWDGDEQFLAAVAAHVSAVMERDQLLKTSRDASHQAAQRIDEVATIYEIGQAINASELEEVLSLVTAKASAVMGAQACSLLLKDPETEQLIIEASYGLSEDIVKGARVRYGEGIAGKVAQTGEPMLIADVSTDPRFAGEHIIPRQDVISSLCVPLKDEVGEIIGVLSIRRHAPAAPFTQDDLRLFCIFASQAALAITNAQLYTRLNSRIQEMAIVSDLLRAISSTLDLERVLDQIADNILHLVGFDRCCVYLRDPRTDEFVTTIARGYAPGKVPEDRMRYGEGLVGVAAKERIPIFAESSRIRATDSLEDNRPRQSLALPIIARDSCIGAVVVDNDGTRRPIRPESVELLSTFVNQAGIAIENARLYEAMEQKYAELNVLYDQSRTIGSAYGLENAAALLVDVATRAVNSDLGVLCLLDDRRQEAHVACASGLDRAVEIDLADLMRLPEAAHAVRRLRDPFVITNEDGLLCPLGDWAFMGHIFSGYGSVTLAPLIAEDVTVGILVLGRQSENVFQSGEIKLISIIVSQAAVVIKNAIRYEERMRERTLELSALYEFATRISSAASLEEALDSIVSIVTGLVQCDECVIYALDYEHWLASPKAVRYMDGSDHITADEPLDGEGIVGWVVRERKALVSPKISDDPRFAAVAADTPVMSLMSIPLMVQDEVVGVLTIQSYSPNQYTQDDVRVLSIIASQSAAIYKELEALSALTSYTDNILSSIAAGVVTLDSEGLILTWNKAAEQAVGISDDRVVGRLYTQVIDDFKIPQTEKETLVRIIDKVLLTGQTYQAYKLCFNPRMSDTIYANLSASQLKSGSGERLGLVIIFEDVTREIEMEEQFRRMGELAAIGQLAASIAHELRNPLSSIKGAAQYLQKEYEDHPSIVEFLGIIVEEVNGLNKITTEFLDFARPLQLELKPVNLNDIVEKALQLMSVHIADNNVVVTSTLAEGLPNVDADEDQVGQVLRNIILNALQAMPSGGELAIETKQSPGRGLELWVHDTGTGIPEEKLDKIFIPFFTTKTKGTGLGLSVVRKIVENHGGRIIVRSSQNHGSSFGIILPVGGATRVSLPEPEAVERSVSP